MDIIDKKQYDKEYNQRTEVKERKKEKHKNYRKENKNKLNKISRKSYHKHKENNLKTKKEYYKQNKKKIFDKMSKRKEFDEDYAFKCKIRVKHNNLIRSKKYNKENLFCKDCGSKDNLQIHHPDWDNYNYFEILCKQCHINKHHKKEKF